MAAAAEETVSADMDGAALAQGVHAEMPALDTLAGVAVDQVKGGGVFGEDPAATVDPGDLREAVREMLPQAESCALGCASIGRKVGADAESVVRIFEAGGMTVFKNELEFAGCIQPCVSVNKRLRAWVG